MSDEPKDTESQVNDKAEAKTDEHTHSHGDSHGHGDSHAHDDSHGHGHDDHAVPADAIPENSAYDSVLSMLALLVGAALVGLIVYWCSLKPAVVAEGEAGAEHGAQHAVEHVTEPGNASNSAPAESH